MNIEEGRYLLQRALKDRENARAAELLARRTVESSSLIIRGIITQFPELRDEVFGQGAPDSGPEATEESPKGAEAVLRVLQVNENKMFSVADMVNELRERNWLPESDDHSNAVRTALERVLAANPLSVKKLRKAGSVYYRFNEPEPTKEHA